MSLRVLVADDTPANLRLLKNKLRSQYFQVETAENGSEALEIAKRSLPDVVISDVMMPGLSGFELCRLLKQDDATAQIPVILMTSLADKQSRWEGFQAGADDFLSRPVKDDELFHRITVLSRIAGAIRDLETRVSSVASLADGFDAQVRPEDLARAKLSLFDPDDELRSQHASVLRSMLGVEVIEFADPLSDQGLPPNAASDLMIVNVDHMNLDDAFYAASQFSGGSSDAVASKTRSKQFRPVIALGSSRDRTWAEKAERSGVADSIQLPTDSEELAVRTRGLLKRAIYAQRLEEFYQSAIGAALTDELTGLYNRRFATRHVSERIEAANRDGLQMALMMIDLDDFKKINDNLGHPAGDAALRALADSLRQSLRTDDVIARWGGDEFLVLVGEVTGRELEQLAARVLKTASRVKPSGGWLGKGLSLSIGAAMTAGDDSKDWLEVMRQADRALYRVKERGKSGFEIA